MTIYNDKDFAKLRIAGQLGASVLDYITPFVKAGISTLELNNLCHQYIINKGAVPAPLNYNGYPKATCISVNDVVCHGIPSKDEVLQNGDIVNIDITVIKDGYYGDTSRMYTVGKVDEKLSKLINTTYESMMSAISLLKPDVPLSIVGREIERIVKPFKYGIVKEFAGHGIGKKFHEDPNVLHYYVPQYDKYILKAGMVFTVEPMINLGTSNLYIQKDGWVARTNDSKPSAQFEHMVGITKDGYEIFTLSPKGYTTPPYKD